MHQFYRLAVSGTQTDRELSSRADLVLGDIEVLHTEGHPGNSRQTLTLSYYSPHCLSAIYPAAGLLLCHGNKIALFYKAEMWTLANTEEKSQHLVSG